MVLVGGAGGLCALVLGLEDGGRWVPSLALLVDGRVAISVACHRGETKVEVVVSASLTVHLVHKEAGDRLEQQAEDGHAHAEAEDVAAGQRLVRGVVHPEVDDVRHYGQAQPDEQHEHSVYRVPVGDGPYAHSQHTEVPPGVGARQPAHTTPYGQ